ncbi:MAG: hypothetical protein Q8L84_14150 [Hyphomonas sp.]|nr:hypothetical protein [Hyphomonas sp.]
MRTKLVTIVGLLTLMPVSIALSERGGNDESSGLENPLNYVCMTTASHDCEMIASATPEYPRLPELGDAECVVSYRINDDGTVTVVSASCDDPRFVDSAVKGMSSVRYDTRDVCDRACKNVGKEFDYPITFQLDD